MALPLPPFLTPAEVAFLCEMETVTVVPRQRLDSLDLLGGPTPALRPPHRADLPLWLALLLQRQRRANILPPPWLSAPALDDILRRELDAADALTPSAALASTTTTRGKIVVTAPPFVASSAAGADPARLPYHWLELAELLLEACGDEVPQAGAVRGLLRDVREVRMAKMRRVMGRLDGETPAEAGRSVPNLRGVGAMEVAEARAFMAGTVDELRRIGESREAARRQREAEEGDDGLDDDEDEEMGF